jgi:hypothetical protein
MKKVGFLAFAWLLLGVAAACAQDVLYNFAQDANFSKYKTYKWVSIGAEKLEEPVAKEIINVVDGELAKKGLMKTEADTADLYVGFQAATGGEKELRDLGSGWSYGPGWGAGWYGPMPKGATTVAASTIYNGQLDVDIPQRSSWCGVEWFPRRLRGKPSQRIGGKIWKRLWPNY